MLIISAGTVYAVTAYNPDYAYGSDAWAASSFTELASNYACNIHSYMDPAVTVQVIGWTWEACTNKCRYTGGSEAIISQASRDAFVIRGSSASASTYVSKTNPSVPCNPPNYRIVVTQSYHDFNDPAASYGRWTPESNHYQYP